MSPHLYISTGELSGEAHAARLLGAFRTLAPDTRATGMGSQVLRDAGVELLVDTTDHQVMGFVEVLEHVPFFWRAARRAVDHVCANRPDAVILVDNPGFHLRLARAIKRRAPACPVLYYIAPTAWAWHESRVRQLAAYVDELLCILPFEETWFRERGVQATYVGHPTLDRLREAPDGSALRAELGLAPADKLVALFPGSRHKELRRHLPLMRETLSRLADTDARFALSAAPGVHREALAAIADLPPELPIIEQRSHELLAASDAVLAKSGTTTLEAALLQKPMVVLYRTNWLTAKLARAWVRAPWFALPNLMAGREIVPEFFQEEAASVRLAEEIGRLLTEPDHAAAMRQDLADLRRTFGEGDASANAARAVLRFLGGDSHAPPGPADAPAPSAPR